MPLDISRRLVMVRKRHETVRLEFVFVTAIGMLPAGVYHKKVPVYQARTFLGG